MVVAGHDEDDEKRALGRPCDRILRMAAAMLEAVEGLTTPSACTVGWHISWNFVFELGIC